jgi:hypothetical protein
VTGGLTSNNATVCTGILTADGGITATAGIGTTTLTASGLITANAGITVNNAQITANAGITSNTLNVSGNTNVTGTITTDTINGTAIGSTMNIGTNLTTGGSINIGTNAITGNMNIYNNNNATGNLSIGGVLTTNTITGLSNSIIGGTTVGGGTVIINGSGAGYNTLIGNNSNTTGISGVTSIIGPLIITQGSYSTYTSQLGYTLSSAASTTSLTTSFANLVTMSSVVAGVYMVTGQIDVDYSGTPGQTAYIRVSLNVNSAAFNTACVQDFYPSANTGNFYVRIYGIFTLSSTGSLYLGGLNANTSQDTSSVLSYTRIG